MIESLNDILPADESAVDSDLVDFVPDPYQMARVDEEPARMPRWLVAALATGAVITVILMLKPGPATAKAAAEPAAEVTAPAHQDLFQLPEWHDDAPQSPAR